MDHGLQNTLGPPHNGRAMQTSTMHIWAAALVFLLFLPSCFLDTGPGLGIYVGDGGLGADSENGHVVFELVAPIDPGYEDGGMLAPMVDATNLQPEGEEDDAGVVGLANFGSACTTHLDCTEADGDTGFCYDDECINALTQVWAYTGEPCNDVVRCLYYPDEVCNGTCTAPCDGDGCDATLDDPTDCDLLVQCCDTGMCQAVAGAGDQNQCLTTMSIYCD